MKQEQNPQLEEETKNEEEEVEETESEEDESEEDTEEDSEEETDDSNEELERLRQENAKYKRLLKKKGDKKPNTNTGKADNDELRQDVESLKTSERKRQFGYENELSPDEVDKVFQIDPNPSSKTLKDPFVKAGLEGLRKQRRVGENTPSSSAKASPVSGKEFKKLSSTEKDKKWQEHLKNKAQ